MIQILLAEIRNFYQRYAPGACGDHTRITPATEQAIVQFEQQIGLTLPSDYREFLLSNDLRHSFDANYGCLELTEVVHCWQRMANQLAQGHFNDGRIEHHKTEGFGNWDGGFIQEVWWHLHWIPFAEDSCGNMVCIDCAPGPNGHLYQLLNMEVQDGQGPFISDYPSFTAYLECHLHYLQQGRYVADEWGIEVDRWRPEQPLE